MSPQAIHIAHLIGWGLLGVATGTLANMIYWHVKLARWSRENKRLLNECLKHTGKQIP